MGNLIRYPYEATYAQGYLAEPASGAGPGVIVLHAWWGLNDFFKEICDRLAKEGFLVLAPDMYNGKVVKTVEEADQAVGSIDGRENRSRLVAAVDYLKAHPMHQGDDIGVIGFSMGGAWALLLSTLYPHAIAAVVVFYATGEGDFSAARAAYLGHFAPNDEWEPDESVQQLEAALRRAGRDVKFYIYPDTKHWFFEEDRPESYDKSSAFLAWERSLDFLRKHLVK
ncbi:MAG: dienelactone hydrolase family protein [Chloroflexota bacterium]|nr:MAG: dienelactone hydrolase family protein [Chloroflexota bacterium]